LIVLIDQCSSGAKSAKDDARRVPGCLPKGKTA
jgi:hypothetical protein